MAGLGRVASAAVTLPLTLYERPMDSRQVTRQFTLGSSAGSAPGNASQPTLNELPPWMFDSLGPTLNISLWIMVGVSAVFLGLRLYCKAAKHMGLWWDDYVLAASWILFVVNAVTASVDVSMGLGQHIEVLILRVVNIPPLMRLLSISSLMGILGAAWSKTSFAITLLRLTDGWAKKLVWCTIISMNLIMIANGLTAFLACNPPAKQWDPTISGTCWNPVAFSVFAGSYSGAMDLLLSLLPWKITWKLQMKRKEKLGVAFAMSMGIVAGAASFVKSAKISTIQDADPTFAIPELVIWGGAEIALTIVAASIPVLRVLLREARSSSNRRADYEHAYNLGEDNSYGYGFGSKSGTVLRSRVSISGGHPRTFYNSADLGVSQQGLKRAGSLPSKDSAGDDGSDKSILNIAVAPGQIVQTQEVNIEYSRSPQAIAHLKPACEGSDEYELGRMR